MQRPDELLPQPLVQSRQLLNQEPISEPVDTPLDHDGLANVYGGSPLDESFFDLDIDDYYANGNNACGFIPGAPVILSDDNQFEADYIQSYHLDSPDLTSSVNRK